MPSQYIDKINLPGNKEIELRDTISELKDVNITSLASGNALVFNGSSWVNHTISGGGGSGDPAMIVYASKNVVGDNVTITNVTESITDIVAAFIDDSRPVYMVVDNEYVFEVIDIKRTPRLYVKFYCSLINTTANKSYIIEGASDGTSDTWDYSESVIFLNHIGDVNVSNVTNGQILTYRNGFWVNETASGGSGGLNKIELYFDISTNGRDEIFFSDFITDPDLDICDLYIENDGTVPQAPIWIDALPKECVNIYLKNTNTTNPQGITVRFKFGSDFVDYAVYDDGNLTYNSDYIDINIPRNKVIEFSIKQYLNSSSDPVISIIYSDPLTIQAI